jgi:hypothetical protein
VDEKYAVFLLGLLYYTTLIFSGNVTSKGIPKVSGA